MRLSFLVLAVLLATGDVFASQPALPGQPAARAVSSKPMSKPSNAPKTFPTFATTAAPTPSPPSPATTTAAATTIFQNGTASSTTTTTGLSGGSKSSTLGLAVDPFYPTVGMAVACIVIGVL